MKQFNFKIAALCGVGLLCAHQSALAACSYKVTNNWGAGLVAEVTVTNSGTSAVSSWNVGWQFANNRVTSSWNANVSGSNPYSASNVAWNGNLQPGQSAVFGVQVETNGAAETPQLTGSICGGAVASSSVTASSIPASSMKSSVPSSIARSSIASSIKSSTPASIQASSIPASSRSSIASSKASSSLPNNVSILLEENQTGFCAAEGTIDSNNTGFTGNGFANSTNAAGAGVEWSINVKTSGSYSFTWRYAAITARNADLIVNGNVQAANISFPATNSWTTWSNSTTARVQLNAGTHKIRLQALSSDGLSNIDSLTVSGTSVTAANCDTPSTPISLVSPTFSNIAVHDPSVVFANNQYYVFG
ncbi:MAG TPA: cellulose binding domain-containing protein, partial [Cellvibrio sp.]|nr:cellulose binding domain-containing protein [Cellvibrio sp.]